MTIRSPRRRFAIRLAASLLLGSALWVALVMRFQTLAGERQQRLETLGVLQTVRVDATPTGGGCAAAYIRVRQYFTESDVYHCVRLVGSRDVSQLDAIRADLPKLSPHRLTNISLEAMPSGSLATLLPRRWHNLRHLVVMNCGFTDTDLATLPDAPDLESICLVDAPEVTTAGLASLARFPNLEQLSLQRIGIGDAGLADALAPLTLLKRLDVDGCRVGPDAVRVAAANAPQLAFLSFQQTDITDADLAALPLMPTLINLTLDGSPITGAGLHLLRLPRIGHLSLAGCPLDSSAVAGWSGRMRATSLLLSHTPLTDAALPGIGHPGLSMLWLDHTQLTDAGLPALATCTGLQMLTLSDTHITDAGIRTLTALPALWELDLSGTAISNAGVAALAAHPSLQNLGLARCRITDDCVPSLISMPKLTHLDVTGTALTPAAVERLKLRDVSVIGP